MSYENSKVPGDVTCRWCGTVYKDVQFLVNCCDTWSFTEDAKKVLAPICEEGKKREK